MNARLALALAVLAAVPVRPFAAELTKVRGRSFAIVFAEKVSPAEAAAAVKQLRAHAPIVEFGADFPMTVPSEELARFTPGISLSVLGYCKSRDDANAAADIAAPSVPSVMVREAAAEEGPGTCPVIRKPKPLVWKGFKIKDSGLSVKPTLLSWTWLTRGSAECGDAGIRLQEGKRILVERQYKSERCEPGGTRVAYEVQPLELGGRTFWLVAKHVDFVESGGGELTLVALACGDLRDVYKSVWAGAGIGVTFESMAEDRWTGLRVSGGGGSSLLHWDEASCEYKRVE